MIRNQQGESPDIRPRVRAIRAIPEIRTILRAAFLLMSAGLVPGCSPTSPPTPSALPTAPYGAAVRVPPFAAPGEQQDIPAQVTWEINTSPSAAKVLDASTQQELGYTPWRFSQPAAAGERTIRIQKSGYKPLDVAVSRNRSEKRHLQLRVSIVL